MTQKKIEELVEWVAASYRKLFWDAVKFPFNTPVNIKARFTELAKETLSHPDLYFRDFDIEVEGLHDLWKAFTPLAEAIKGAKPLNKKEEGEK